MLLTQAGRYQLFIKINYIFETGVILVLFNTHCGPTFHIISSRRVTKIAILIDHFC